MLELEEAQARILSALPPTVAETVALSQACGRILAQSIVSEVDLPPFDNSAMDGYAIRSADVAAASPESPITLRMTGRVPAGEVFAGVVETGSCVRLFTGSPMPRGADAVVMQEDTALDMENKGSILVKDAVKPWENVRFHGEDVKRRSPLGAVGSVISVGRLALLSAAGCREVSVGRRPVVGLLATGSELRETSQTLQPGQIYESNRATLAALVQRAGGVPQAYPLVPDNLESTRLALREAFRECDFVITSGGVSVGEMDFVKQAFEEIGGRLEFWKVAIRPGRPFVFGQMDKKFLFGLPGNPVSALVTFLLLVRPALLRWQGATETALPVHLATVAEPITNSGNRRHFMRIRVGKNGDVQSAGTQASHILSAVAESNGLVDLAPGQTLAQGEIIPVMRWEI